MKKAELLKRDHNVQLKWLKNQMDKIANDGAMSFSNADTAERAYNKLAKGLVINDSDLEHFMSVHLSTVGTRKLVTTLRVSLKRSNAKYNNLERLQVEITKNNSERLDHLLEISDCKTKREVINKLIREADITSFKRSEEQLSIDI